MRIRIQLLISGVLTVAICAGMTWLARDSENAWASISTNQASPVEYPGIENVVAFHDDLYSGGKPDGNVGMMSLAGLGVRTIICVDGVAPDVDAARKHGIRTIHIPLRYAAPNGRQILDLAVAFASQRKRGKVYVHCHHGMHRSSAAAALMLRSLGLASMDTVKQRMAVAGTSHHYHGLWKAVDQQTTITPSDLAEHDPVLPSTVQPRGITAQMASLDAALDRLILVKQSHWSIPRSHPDLSPAADAGLLADTFRLMKLDSDHRLSQMDYEADLERAMNHASALEQDLVSGVTQIRLLDQHLHRIQHSCISCHAQWRK